MTRPRDIGTAAESAVVRAIRPWFPHAERRALRGGLDCGDITGTPLVAWEVKAGAAAMTASDAQVAAWLAETERERVNARADVGVLVLKRKGVGPAHAVHWWAVVPLGFVVGHYGPPGELSDAPVRLHLHTACDLLALRGYGQRRAA